MKREIKYSVLKYRPSMVSGESINVGFLVHDELEGSTRFYYSRRFKRIQEFDDELNIETVRFFLEDMALDIARERKSFDIDEYIRFYINAFYFDKVEKFICDNIDEAVDLIRKVYLRFDLEKPLRPSKGEDAKIIKERAICAGENINKSSVIYGKYNDKINYDIVTDHYKIKFFDWENKDLSRSINAAKLFAWNSENSDDRKAIAIYRYAESTDVVRKQFEIIKSILQAANVEVIKMGEDLPRFSA